MTDLARGLKPCRLRGKDLGPHAVDGPVDVHLVAATRRSDRADVRDGGARQRDLHLNSARPEVDGVTLDDALRIRRCAG